MANSQIKQLITSKYYFPWIRKKELPNKITVRLVEIGLIPVLTEEEESDNYTFYT